MDSSSPTVSSFQVSLRSMETATYGSRQHVPSVLSLSLRLRELVSRSGTTRSSSTGATFVCFQEGQSNQLVSLLVSTAHRHRDSFMEKKFAHPSGLEISMVTNIITPRLCWTGREPFDPLCFHPSGEQNSVCFDVTMKCELLALVRTQVRALEFRRNQRWKPCLAASPRRMRTAVGSACLTIAAKGSLQLDSSHRLHLL